MCCIQEQNYAQNAFHDLDVYLREMIDIYIFPFKHLSVHVFSYAMLEL